MDDWKTVTADLLRKFNSEGYWPTAHMDAPIMLTDRTLVTALGFFENFPSELPHPKFHLSGAEDGEDDSYIVCHWDGEDHNFMLILEYNSLQGSWKPLGGKWNHIDGSTPYSGGEIPKEFLDLVPLKTIWAPSIYEVIESKKKEQQYKLLDELLNEGIQYDGDEFYKISQDTFDAAKHFISLIPYQYVLPTLSPNENQDLVIRWTETDTSFVIISGWKIHYGENVEGDKPNYVDDIDFNLKDTKLPPEIDSLLERIYG
jgi:hypothetical protein